MKRTFKEIVKEQVPPEVIIVSAFILMIVAGYGAWTMENSGTISIIAPLYDTQIYIDSSLVGTSRTAGQKMTFDESSGPHDVLISKDGYWPWTEAAEVQKNKTISLSPFLIQKNVQTNPLSPPLSLSGATATNTEYASDLALFQNLLIGESAQAILHTAGLKEVKYADFFPGRDDVLIVAAGNKIFAIDANNTHPRNYQPIYEGTAPIFVKTKDNIILVKDGDNLFSLKDLSPTLQ